MSDTGDRVHHQTSFDAEHGSKVATSAINLAIGVITSAILVGVGRSAAHVAD